MSEGEILDTEDQEHIPASAGRVNGGDTGGRPVQTVKTVQGLADALFATIDDVRNGAMRGEDAMVVAKLSAQVVSTINLRMKMMKLGLEAGDKGQELLKLAG